MRKMRDPNEWRRTYQDLKALGRDYGAILVALTPFDIAYDLASLIAGRDLLSGNRLTNFETAAILVGFFTAGLGDDILGGGSRLLRGLDDADDVAARAGRELSHLDETTALRLSRLDDFTAGDRALLRGDDLRRALASLDDGGSALSRRLDAVAVDAVAERRAAEVWVKAGVDRETANKLAKKGLLPIAGGSGSDDAARAARRVDDVIPPSRALVPYDPEFAVWQVQQSVSSAMAPHLDDIRKLAPDADVGFRGSLARGRKGPHKGDALFDPTDFDVDALIVSDDLAARYPKSRWWRSGDDIPELKAIQEQVDTALRKQFPGLRADDPFTFRIYTRDEFARKVKPDERFFIGR